MNREWRPNFIVIGAVKSATTWILKQLQRNGNVFLPNPEPHYFSQDFDRGIEFYRGFFQDRPLEATVVGEKSADYLAHPLAADRIASMLPDVQLVVQLRDPVARAYSDYKMLYRRGTVKGPPEDYLLSLDTTQPRFLLDGLYGQHLKRWLSRFPSEHILTYLYDDITSDPRSTVERVSAHIGVSPQFDETAAARKENSSREKILPLSLRMALSPFKGIVSPHRNKPLFEVTRSLFAREIPYPPLSSELEKHMRDFYRPDIEVLETLIGRDLSFWKTVELGATQTPEASTPI